MITSSTEFIAVGDLNIPVSRKNIRHVHIAVYPPDGYVCISAPLDRRSEVIRAFALTRLGWIKARQAEFQTQSRQGELDFITRESHYLWGRRYLLVVEEEESAPRIEVMPRQIVLTVRPGSDKACRERIMHDWHKSLLRKELAPLIRQWEKTLGVTVNAFFVQKMKTKWGSCTPGRGYVRFNTELVKKPKDLLEYIVVHELCHLLEPRHSEKYFALLSHYYPRWKEAREFLNELPVA